MSKAAPINSSGSTIEHSDRPERSRKHDRDRDRNLKREESARQSAQKSNTRGVYEVEEHPFELRHEVKRLNTRLDKIADSLEKSDFKDIVENYMNPKKRMITNFTAGLSRGLGMTVGTAIVLGLLGYILSLVVNLNLPVIGDFISNLLSYVETSK